MHNKVVQRALFFLVVPLAFALYHLMADFDVPYLGLSALLFLMIWVLVETGLLFLAGIIVLIQSYFKLRSSGMSDVAKEENGAYLRLQSLGNAFLKAAFLVFLMGAALYIVLLTLLEYRF